MCNKKKGVGFTILIPFRNEASNLPYVLKSISRLEYSLASFEIILIDDASTDESMLIIQDFMAQQPSLSMSCLPSKRQTGSPKKDALTVGVHHASHEWILTTDADCTLEKTWLLSLNHFIQEFQPKMVVAPVSIATPKPISFLNAYEQLDFLSLMGTTIGGFGMGLPFLCNGANLAYEKEAFTIVNGYQDNDHIASGDDHFLLEKFVKTFPDKVRYLNSLEASVTTQAQPNWKGLISQRVRWASKTSAYTFWFSKAVGLIVLFANLVTSVLLIYVLLSLCLDFAFATALSAPLLLLTIVIKYTVDFVLIARSARFFDRKKYLKWYPLVMVCYPFITLYIVLKSLSFSYEWKGRRFKQ